MGLFAAQAVATPQMSPSTARSMRCAGELSSAKAVHRQRLPDEFLRLGDVNKLLLIPKLRVLAMV